MTSILAAIRLAWTFRRYIAIAAGVIALIGALVWAVDAIGDAREEKVRAEYDARDRAAAVKQLTTIANENAAIAIDIQAFADKKAEVKATRSNRNWEQSERLNNDLFKKIANSAPGPCNAADIGAVSDAIDWVWSEAARAGDPRATGGAEGGPRPDGTDSRTIAAP